MIIKCTKCNNPMTQSMKNKPDNIPAQNDWVMCRKCNLGVEVIGSVPSGGSNPAVVAAPSNVKEMNFEETTYITIKQTDDGVIKFRYSDKDRKIQISEEKLG